MSIFWTFDSSCFNCEGDITEADCDLADDCECVICENCRKEYSALANHYRPGSKASRYDAEGLRLRTPEHRRPR